MGTLDRYILRQLGQAFVLTLIVLSALGWLSQVVSFLDIVVEKGRPLSDFLTVTGLIVPLIASLLAPTAMFIACVYVLNRLDGDSELVVMHASGVSYGGLLRPFLIVAVGATVLMVGLNLYGKPWGMRTARDKLTEIRADLIASVVREGQFVSPEKGVTIHVKSQNGAEELAGVIFNDARNPEWTVTYLAERARIVETGKTTVLILQNGTVQRRREGSEALDVLAFEEYALDLGAYIGRPDGSYRPAERYMSELLETPGFGRAGSSGAAATAEVHDRLSTPLWPLAAALIAFAGMAGARPTRESRVRSILVVSVLAFTARMSGAGVILMMANDAPLAPLAYAIPIGTIAAAGGVIAWQATHGSKARPVEEAEEPDAAAPEELEAPDMAEASNAAEAADAEATDVAETPDAAEDGGEAGLAEPEIRPAT